MKTYLFLLRAMLGLALFACSGCIIYPTAGGFVYRSWGYSPHDRGFYGIQRSWGYPWHGASPGYYRHYGGFRNDGGRPMWRHRGPWRR